MKSTFSRSVNFLIVLTALVLMGEFSSAQLPLLDKITKSTSENDTSNVKQEISIDNVNKEIEFTDNLILNKNLSEFSTKKQNTLIQSVNSFHTYIAKQGVEFRQFEPDKLTHYFLINARFSWIEYQKNLRNYQDDLQKIIREIQEQQSFYVNNKVKWERSLPNLEKTLTAQIRNHIDSNLDKMNQIINEFDLRIRNLITTENKIVQDIVFVDGILNEINSLNDKRKSELFKQNEKNIFSVSFSDSFSGSVSDRLNLAFRDNTKTFGYFYSSIKSNLITFLLLLIILISYFIFIRKKYIQLNYNESNPEFYRINRIVIQKPGLTVLVIIFILWIIVIPYSPMVLSLFLYLASLIIILRILSTIIDPFIRKIEIAVIILLTLSNFEIFAWYFNNFSRFYLLLESVAGIALTYKYILPGYKVDKFRNQNKRLLLSVRIITIFIFLLYSIALVSNLWGFVNMSGYCVKLGVYTGVISMLVHGFYRISYTIIHASVDVLNIYYPEIVRKYDFSIRNKSSRYLKFILGFIWISGILRISEIYEIVSSAIVNIFTDKVKIGTLSFSLGKLVLFIGVLYFTFVLARFTKRIFEREILARHEMKRGVAASISLTIRIFIVFFGTLIALSLSGLDFSKIGIIAGALSVGIGFGLQNIVNNFISGLILVYEKPVQEGDTIEVDTLLGRVSNIGTRSSTITTYDGAEVVVPNSNLISNQLINWTLSDNIKRVEIKVGTSYDSNPHQVLDLLLNAALSHEKVLKYPEPRPLFVGFGDNSLDFRILFWVRFEDGLTTQSDVALKIFDILKENNIKIPFPQLDLYIKNPKDDFLNDKSGNLNE